MESKSSPDYDFNESHEGLPPANLLILGLPGSGKTTLGEIMDERSDGDLAYVSLGDISRNLPANDPRREYVDSLYKDQNKPVGDPSFFVELLRPEIEKVIESQRGVILDGMPKKEEEIEPLSNMLEELGVRIDAVVICEVSPFTALRRVMERGSREGGLDTVETAINRGEVYDHTIDGIVQKIGGFLSAKVVKVDTESMAPEDAATKAQDILAEIRKREAEATVLNMDLSMEALEEEAVGRIIHGVKHEDDKRIQEGLVDLFIPDEFRQSVKEIYATSEATEELPLVEVISEYISQDGEFSYLPKARERYSEMLHSNLFVPLNRLRNVVKQESELRARDGGKIQEHVKKVLREIKISQLVMDEYQQKANNTVRYEEFLNHEMAVRGRDLKYVEEYLHSEEAIESSMSIRQLMEVQLKYWNIFTSSEIIGTVDGNYQKLLNNIDGEHHSLAPPVAMPRSIIANSIKEYRPFIEAVSTTRRSSFDTSLGFLHVVGVDKAGRAFQVEWPILMYDPRLAQHQNGLLRDMLSRGQEIYFNHDLWHNLIPVYAESFHLNHPHAPISYGGLREAYTEFGLDMRKEKEEYEIMVAMNHARSMQLRVHSDEEFAQHQIGAAFSILNDIPLLKKQLEESDGEDFATDTVNYFATVTIGRLLNIIEPNDPVLKPIIAKLEKYDFLENEVRVNDVVDVMFTQRAILADKEHRLSYMQKMYEIDDLDEELREKIIGGLLKTINDSDARKGEIPDKVVKAICSNNELCSLALRYADPGSSYAESGAQELYDSLLDIGLTEVVQNKIQSKSLKGVNLLRWYAIVAPQRKPLKGHMEKVHGKRHVRFGDEFIPPAQVLSRQTSALMRDNDVYEYRRWARNYGQELSLRIYNLLFEDEQSELQGERRLLSILHRYTTEEESDGASIGEGINALDLMLDKLVKADYSSSKSIRAAVSDMANVVVRYSEDLHEALSEVLERYYFLAKQEAVYQNYENTNYALSKSELEASTMDLVKES